MLLAHMWWQRGCPGRRLRFDFWTETFDEWMDVLVSVASIFVGIVIRMYVPLATPSIRKQFDNPNVWRFSIAKRSSFQYLLLLALLP